MRLNQFVARATGMSRRSADSAIAEKRVRINGEIAGIGSTLNPGDEVYLDGQKLSLPETRTIMLNKPAGYVCSRDGQGSKTIYDLLPPDMYELKPVGRLDKDSSGLLILTNDGQLANELTHPRFSKSKIYKISLDKHLTEKDAEKIRQGIELEDGLSRLSLDGSGTDWTVTMSEGRNRQIRRTFAALGYTVTRLHRTHFGPYSIGELTEGDILSPS